MSEPTPPAAPAQSATTDRPVKQTERPHPLTPLIRGWVVLLAIVVGVGREFIPDGSDEGAGIFSLGLTWILLGVLGIVMLAAVAGFLSWYFTRYVIDDEELRIETGALFKNSKRVPFERVQSVDIIQQFAARIFGLAELRIEVGVRRLHHQAALPHPRPGVLAARLPAQPRPRRPGPDRRGQQRTGPACSPTSPSPTSRW